MLTALLLGEKDYVKYPKARNMPVPSCLYWSRKKCICYTLVAFKISY